MKQDEPSELTREETVAKWQRRQKQDQRRTEELEREPWRLSKRIKAQDPYHFVIMPTLIEQLLGILMTKKIAIDKLTESITVESRYLLLVHRQRVIPFSAVRSVVVDYKYVSSSQGGGRDFWTVSLNAHSKKVQIGSGSNEGDMYGLANAISRIIKKEIEVNSNKPESDIFKKKAFHKDGLPRDWKL